MLGDSVEETVCRSIVALTRSTKSAGDGACHNEEIERCLLKSVVEVDSPLYLGISAEFPALVAHCVEKTILVGVLVHAASA